MSVPTDEPIGLHDEQQLPAAPSVDPVERARTARALFNLPAKVNLLHEVFASCKVNSVYVAGRLYIFNQYVAFYASSFGTHVQAIRRRQHLSRPNALEIKYTSGAGHKYEVLANLEDREGIFRALLDLWEVVNPEACKFYRDNVHMQQTWREKKLKKLVGMVGMAGMLPEDQALDLDGSVAEEEEPLRPAPTCTEDGITTPSDEAPAWKQQWIQGLSDAASCPDADAPRMHPEASLVAEGLLQGSVQDYVQHILFSDMMRRFQEKHNSLNVALSVWQPVDDSSMTLARQMEWTLQRKNPFGPSTMECSQSQRLSLYRNHHVVLQTELSVPAVPYGDYFVVCARWDVQPGAQDGHFSWKHTAWVSFIKDTVFKRQIVTASLSGMKESNALQVAAIAEELQRAREHAHVKPSRAPTVSEKVEASLQSLFARVPSMMRPDVYKLVKAHLEGEASAAPRGPKEVPATVVQQQPTWLLWVVLGLTLCNTCVCLLVLRLALAFRAVDACLAGVSS